MNQILSLHAVSTSQGMRVRDYVLKHLENPSPAGFSSPASGLIASLTHPHPINWDNTSTPPETIVISTKFDPLHPRNHTIFKPAYRLNREAFTKVHRQYVTERAKRPASIEKLRTAVCYAHI